MSEREQHIEQKSELEIAADRFLTLLYRYDMVGKDAYFKNTKRYEEDTEMLSRYINKSDYYSFKGNKYIWMKAPYLRLAITKEGNIFIAPRPHSLVGATALGDIHMFLNEDLWGKNIFRVHTAARHGTDQYESAVFHYHNLHIVR